MKMNEFDDQINRRMKPPARKMLNLFLRGLLVVLPIALTVSILIWVLQILGSFLHLDKLSFGAVFLYLILGIVAITFIGKFTEGVVAKQILEFLEGIIEKAPGLNWIFGTTKDMTQAFVGENKKFTIAVKVEIFKDVYRIGFLTQNEMDEFGMPGFCAVYFPNSYSISGEIMVERKEKVVKLDIDSGDITKFILSGGVTEMK
jgi:uncharacterized membrane protein